MRGNEAEEFATGPYTKANMVNVGADRARLIDPAPSLEYHWVEYSFPEFSSQFMPVAFSFHSYPSHGLLDRVNVGGQSFLRPCQLDAVHPSNFPRGGPQALGLHYPVVNPGVKLSAVVRFPTRASWKGLKFSAWSVMLER